MLWPCYFAFVKKHLDQDLTVPVCHGLPAPITILSGVIGLLLFPRGGSAVAARSCAQQMSMQRHSTLVHGID